MNGDGNKNILIRDLPIDEFRDSYEIGCMFDDIEKPLFSQQQLLRVLPSLKPKALQNWAARGILDAGEQKPGKQGKRLYSPVDAIKLGFMWEIGHYGVPPATAKELAELVGEVAIEFWQSNPKFVMNEGFNCPWLPIYPEQLSKLKRAIITHQPNEDGEAGFHMVVVDEESFDYSKPGTEQFRFTHKLSITFEIDYHIITTLNQVFLVEGGHV